MLTIHLLATAVALAPLPQESGRGTSFVEGYLARASRQLEKGETEAAKASVRRALERDARYLPALRLLADIGEKSDDADLAVHALHRWIDAWDAQIGGGARHEDRRAVVDRLLALDPEARSWERLQARYSRDLVEIGRLYERREDWLGALDVYQHLLQVDPDHGRAKAAVARIRRTGGREVAVEDLYAGGDPTEGLSSEQIAEMDRRHSTWAEAYTDETENYRYRTDAGFLVLKTSAIAMEQMNRFYRRFFRYKEDGGKTPQIEIRVFKNRDEYLVQGRNPQPWSGGQFTGDAVETYVGGTTGRASVAEMYRTLFHEAAHQFVSLTGPGVPGWLNEAYASFFEGCVILSNGTVKWNQVPPGRLFPLAERLERGFMRDPGEAGPDAAGEWPEPERAPTFRMVVENDYQWGPPWYAPTWGVVYFLYNYRAEDGRPVYRDALHAYYESFVEGQPTNPVAHFEETVLAAAPLSPVRTVDALAAVWKDWILALRDELTGKAEQGDRLLEWAEAALERDEPEVALEFLEEAREDRPEDPEVLWRLASLLEELKHTSRAAARYREFERILEVRGETDDPRHETAGRKILRLDPLMSRYRAVKQRLAEKGLELARSYEERELPTMALEIARRMSANFSIPEALDYYVDLATRAGKSLARWRVAYNERDLDGWSDSGDAYQAYGRTIRSAVAPEGEAMVTRELTCDVTFDADFSLEAEMRIGTDGSGAFEGRLVGLCFGRKSTDDLHAVLLHPDGYLDVSTNRGGEWTVLDHRSLPVGDDWHTLRIDVTGATLDVYYDGLYVRSLEFPSPAVVRGGFGLICGPGEAGFRDIRILERDPFDPAARIERELAMKRVLEDESLRQPGTFSGFAPPELRGLRWLQGEGVTLEELRGSPVMLVFWSPAANEVIPCAAYVQHLARKGKAVGLTAVVICDGGTDVAGLRAYLEEHGMPDARVAIDAAGKAYDDYYVKPGFFGMPRFLLVDAQGKVVFEGDPGLKTGRGWRPEDGPTYVDAAFEKLLGGSR